MQYIKLNSHQALITEVSGEVADFAAFLDIPYKIQSEDDHIYIVDSTLPLVLESFYIRRDTDVMVSAEVFCEILMDIKSGMSVLEAYNNQGYTF